MNIKQAVFDVKYLAGFEELDPGLGFDSMRNFMESAPYEGQEDIARYLDAGRKTYTATSGYPHDVFDGETIKTELAGMTDGEYSWNTCLSHYVRKYNLRLPKCFEDKVFSLSK